MLTNPTEFLQPQVEELEYLIESQQWEEAEVLADFLYEYEHLFDAELLDKYYYWIDTIQTGLRYE